MAAKKMYLWYALCTVCVFIFLVVFIDYALRYTILKNIIDTIGINVVWNGLDLFSFFDSIAL
jgi:hypothetical protein